MIPKRDALAMKQFVLVLNVTIIMCAYISVEVYSACIDLPYRSSQYIYKLLSGNTSIENAKELAARDGGRLIVIDDQQTEQEVLEFMNTCDIDQAWLGIQQVPPDRLLIDSGPWSWESGCDNQHDAVIRFQGCYVENNNDRDLAMNSDLSSDEVTADNCITTCRNLDQKYAGIQQLINDEYVCYCGQSYGKHGAATGCNYTCPEGTNHSCGGIGRNSVYHTKNNSLWGNWLENYPVYNQSLPYCAYISRHEYKLVLKNHKCDEKLPFLCSMKRNVSDCTFMGFFSIEMTEHMCYYLSSEPKVWQNAKLACSEIGGDLLVISNEYVEYIIEFWIRGPAFRRLTMFWVGASRETFRRLDNDGAVCYTKFSGKLRRHTNAYVKSQDGELKWKLSGNPDSPVSFAAAVAQYRILETTTVVQGTDAEYTQHPTVGSNCILGDCSTSSLVHPTGGSDCISGNCATSSTEHPTDQAESRVTTHETDTSAGHAENTTQLIDETTSSTNITNGVIGQEENQDIQSNISIGLVVIIVLIVLLYHCLVMSVLLYYKRRHVPERSRQLTLAKKNHRRNRLKNKGVNNKLNRTVNTEASLNLDSESTDHYSSITYSSVSGDSEIRETESGKYQEKAWKGGKVVYFGRQSRESSDGNETATDDDIID